MRTRIKSRKLTQGQDGKWYVRYEVIFKAKETKFMQDLSAGEHKAEVWFDGTLYSLRFVDGEKATGIARRASAKRAVELGWKLGLSSDNIK